MNPKALFVVLFLAAAGPAYAEKNPLLQSVKPEPPKPKIVPSGFRPQLQKLKVELGLLNYVCLEGLLKANGNEAVAAPIFRSTMGKVVACIERDQRRPNGDEFELCLQGSVADLYGFVARTAYPNVNPRVCPPPPPPPPAAPRQAPVSAKVEEGLRHLRDNAAERAEPLFDEAIAYYTKEANGRFNSYLCVTGDEDLKRILAAFPDRRGANGIDVAFCDALHAKAQILARRKDYEAALLVLEKESPMRPGDIEVMVASGEMFTQLQRYREASRIFEQAMRSASSSEPPLRSRVYLGFAASQVGLGNLTAARKAAEESLRLDPQNSAARDELRYIDTLEEQRRAQPGGLKR